MATLESRACPGRYSNEQARGHGIGDWRTMNDWIFCHLQQCARKAEQGWFLIDLDNGYLGWVHRDVACEHPTCPMAGVRHRHVATPHERERTQTLYVTPWLEECCRRSEAAAGGCRGIVAHLVPQPGTVLLQLRVAAPRRTTRGLCMERLIEDVLV